MTRNLRHSRIPRMLKIHVYPLKYQKATISADYAKIAQFATPQSQITQNSHNSYKNPTNPCSPTVPQFLQQIPRNSLTSQRFRAIDAKLTHFALIPTNILVYFSDSRKTGFSTLLTRITRNS